MSHYDVSYRQHLNLIINIFIVIATRVIVCIKMLLALLVKNVYGLGKEKGEIRITYTVCAHVSVSNICVLILCEPVHFCLYVVSPLQQCQHIKRKNACVCCWMNYLLPTFRTWQNSKSKPCWTLVSQTLSLQTLPCVACNGSFTEMTEWRLKRMSMCLLLVSVIEMALHESMFVWN